MDEKYLIIIYNIYHFRYIINTGKILKLGLAKIIRLPELCKFNVLRINKLYYILI